LGIFKLFLPDPILDCIVKNTNNSEEGHIGLGNQMPRLIIGFR
jgi:hypothetical protein